MVAGIIARVAPEAKILPVRVLSADGSGSVFDAVRGLRWARTRGAQVVNLSFGVATRSAILQDAVEEALRDGVVIVAAAGNAGLELPEYPAALRNVVAVASVEADGTRSAYSNFGAHISLCAPGTGITSTFVNGEFATWSGTSFSAPLVSGAAALLRSARPGMPNGSVAALLRKTARSVDAANPGLAGKLGRGVLDIDGAVASSASVPCPRPSSRATKQGR
jgi:subtilisin family serine protease